MNFSFQNHIKYTIGGRLFGYRETPIEKFHVSVGSIDKDHYRKSNFKKELLRTADLIKSDFGSDLVIFLSGGTDSEIALKNFIDIGFKPTCYTIRFKEGYNFEDVEEAKKITKELNVKHKIIDFDIMNFIRSGELHEFASEIQCSQIAYLIVYKSILNLGLPAVMGGELLLKKDILTTPSSWYYCLRENEDCSAMRFSLKYKIPLVNEYFSYTPELMLYYLKNTEIKNLVSNRFNYKLSSVSSKNYILHKLYPKIMVRKKTHGFENLVGLNFEIGKELSTKQIPRLEHSLDGIEYNKIIQILRGENENC
jgi:hypothetical protein